ncbi:hypothetical protein T281_16105 [Rhodomicrobium udaipurense JA643]|uniref:Uncharacterized protein n=1 Tax=Rhodomicrobium udaipurense TaxID=1202716 RepID=A0A8I1GG55_9HYPH|nr:hypothetical protein [Rhodomicrobium udaipurense]KAI93535.1 hypothetical protein T281_16105 [Rhodomicrobium udaipurense JA643]MBJ7543231.1 hypothetical protein [Rhodomicrobium udaipurense]
MSPKEFLKVFFKALPAAKYNPRRAWGWAMLCRELDKTFAFDVNVLTDSQLEEAVEEARWRGLLTDQDLSEEALSLLRRGDLPALETLLERQLPSGLGHQTQQEKYEAAMAAKRERAA